jgi:hypothetical protein
MYSIGHYLVTLSIFLVLHISGNVQTDHVVLLFDHSLLLSCFNNIAAGGNYQQSNVLILGTLSLDGHFGDSACFNNICLGWFSSLSYLHCIICNIMLSFVCCCIIENKNRIGRLFICSIIC